MRGFHDFHLRQKTLPDDHGEGECRFIPPSFPRRRESRRFVICCFPIRTYERFFWSLTKLDSRLRGNDEVVWAVSEGMNSEWADFYEGIS